MKAALFDVFGTVVDWRSGVARDVSSFLDARKITEIDPFAFADAWRDRYAFAMAKVNSDQRSFVPLDVLHRENLEATLTAFGLPADGFSDVDLDGLNQSWHRLDPWPDSVAGLGRLKSGMIIAPLSNGNISLLLNMAKRASLPWDAILGAEVVKAYKPAPAAYIKTAKILGLPCEEILMVAAHNDDLRAARVCGMKTAFILRSEEHGTGQTTDLAPSDDWEFVAADMNDLAMQLSL